MQDSSYTLFVYNNWDIMEIVVLETFLFYDFDHGAN